MWSSSTNGPVIWIAATTDFVAFILKSGHVWSNELRKININSPLISAV